MRKYVIIALVLLVGGIAASFYLIPNSAEVAVMQQKDIQAVDLGNVDLDAEYAQGRRTFPIMAALADKRVAAGDRPGAVKLLEEYVAASPTDVAGHKKLAEQYQLSGNQEGFYKEIELIAAAAPTEQNLRVLSDMYNASKEYAKQADVLKRIVEVTQGNNPQAFVDLATIQVVIGDSDAALKTVEALKAKHPTFSSYPMTRIMVSVLADKGEVDRAYDVAKEWIDTPRAPVPAAKAPVAATADAAAPAAPLAAPAAADARPQELADLCNILHYSGHADKAVQLVELHTDMFDREPQLVLAYVNASITAGRSEQAYTVLKAIDESGGMIAALYPPYLDLTLAREDVVSAEGIATKLDVSGFNEEYALAIIEVARARTAPSVMNILLSRFNEPTLLTDKPVLNAVIAILANDKAQDTKIESALNTQLTETQRIRLAESCARASKTACFDAIVKQYPPLEQMAPTQVAAFAQLYIIANRPAELVDPVGTLANAEHSAVDVQTAHRRLAAAAGREDVLKPWLEANANAVPVAQLQELFYLANDRHHTEVSSDIAERLYARDPSPMHRDIMISAYIGAGKYAKALPLLRDQVKDTAVNDGLYTSTLSKLARTDKDARKELADYAQASLQANRGDERQQINYTYILINNGRKPEAMAFAKSRAADKGGEWKKIYAQLTEKPKAAGGKAVKLTREQMVAMANSPKISQANKRQVAFSLLAGGYKDDALVIFKELAKDKPADSQEVKDLMYLWGGKLNAEQLAWVSDRAAKANAYDKEKWGALVAASADDNGLMTYVSKTPDALYNRALRKQYFSVLARSGSKQNYDGAMRNWVAQTTDVPALLDYAAIGQANGFRAAASNGYERVLTLDPNNTKALSEMAALEFSKGKFAAADQKLNKYIAAEQQRPDPETNPAQAHFYKAQLLRRQGKTAEANAEFNYVVQLGAQTGASTPDALSRIYTSQFHLGQVSQAKAGFTQLLEQYPDDKGILADYMSVLIEYKYLDEATRVANQYDKNSPYYGKGAALVGRNSNTASVQQLSGGREMKITFTQPIEGKPPIDLKAAKKLAWLEHSEMGYDSVTISAKPGYVVRYVPTAQEQFAVVAAPAVEYAPDVEAQRQQDLRLQLLYARIEQDAGQTEKARTRLAALKQYYPQDPQLVSFNASMEAASGNRGEAIELYQTAQQLAPENEDYGRAIHALQTGSSNTAPSAQYVKIDQEYRNYGANHENITTISGVARVAARTEMGFNIANDELNPKAIPVAGRYGLSTQGQSVSRQQAELFLAHYFADGSRVQGSLFTSGNIMGDTTNTSIFGNLTSQTYDPTTFGAGLYYAFNNSLGRSELLGEYHKPDWDFPEAVHQYATRDRVGVRHYTTLNSGRTGLGVETSLNNYNIEPYDADLSALGAPYAGVDELDGDDVVQSALLRFNVAQELQPMTDSQPYFGINYGFDGEYLLGKPEEKTDVFGGIYRPFDFRSRENHQLTGVYRDDWTPATHVYAAAGYLYDRLGDHGPVVEGRLTQDITDSVEAGVRARYGLAASANGTNAQDDAVNLGAHLMYKF